MDETLRLINMLDVTMKEKQRLHERVLELEARIHELTTPRICTMQDLIDEDTEKLRIKLGIPKPTL
jgi:uncharacterized protein YlxW (UPF0749 family)